MTVLVVVLGAVAGFAAALICTRWVLPIVLRSQEAHTKDGKLDAGLPLPEALQDAGRIKGWTLLAYRFAMPVVFAVVGGFVAYEVLEGGSR